MAMSKELQQGFNDQIALEFSAAYAYLAMAAYFDARDLPGMAHWMVRQHEEEIEHAHKFFQFMLDRGADVHLGPIAEPAQEFDSVIAVFAAALANEEKVTAAIHSLYRAAEAEGDYAGLPLLSWFINEQLEEEASVSTILSRVRLAGDNPAALFVVDAELGNRPAGGAGDAGGEAG